MPLVILAAAGCGGGGSHGASPDAPPAIDAPAACTPTPLLVGGTDVTQQKWTVIQSGPATMTNGDDFVQLTTTTTSNVGGQLLITLTRPDLFTPPFKLAVVMKVLSIAPHQPDPLDAAVAIMPSITDTFGSTDERSQMISIESNKISCADGKPSVTASLVDGAFHTYTLAVDAARTMTLSIDDQATPVITRKAITTDGTIALGDQTNDASFDSSLQIRSVTLLCP